MKHYSVVVGVCLFLVGLIIGGYNLQLVPAQDDDKKSDFLGNARQNARQLVDQGQQIFRFDTYGDETFWGDQLGLHQVVASTSPSQALDLGLKVDSEKLPPAVVAEIRSGRINLNDPAVTVQLVKANAVLGVIGSFNPDGSLSSVGLTAAGGHSTVDNSVAFGIGKRIDGLANRDLNIGAIVAALPNPPPPFRLRGRAHPRTS